MFNSYPYTDYHELNLDWVVGKIKNVETAEANTKQYAEDADAAKVAAEDAKDIAVAAKDDAVEAKDDAVEAKDDAVEFLTDTRDQLNLLQSRVDNIIPDGTQTAGNLELLDIRVAANGQTWDSAGNAVRGQIDEAIENAVCASDGKYILDADWTFGNIKDSDTPVASTVFVYSSSIMSFTKDTNLHIDINNVAYYIILYDNTDTRTASYQNLTRPVYSIPAGQKFRIQFRKTDSSNLTYANELAEYLTVDSDQHITAYNSDNVAYQLAKTGTVIDCNFYIGNIAAGLFYPNYATRIYSDILQYDQPVTVEARTGYSFFIIFYNPDDTYDRASGKVQKVQMSAGQKFRLLIVQTVEASVPADIEEYRKQVFVYVEADQSVYDSSFMYNGKMHLIAHKGCHHDTIIANSNPAFIEAGVRGLWGCETDIRATSDNVLVCIHDDDVSLTTDGSGNVSSMTYAQVSALHLLNVDSTVSNEHIPTFEEYLKICKMYNLVAFAEIKINYTYSQQIIDMVKKYRMENQTVFIVSSNMILRMRPLTDIPLCVLATPSTLSTITAFRAAYANLAVACDHTSTINETDIENTHADDLAIGFYTINTKADADTRFMQGCDYVISDRLMPEDWQ